MPMLRRRMRRRRIGRAVVGTAVVAGTAGVVRHHQQKRWARQDAEEQQEAYQDQEYDEAPAPEQDAPEQDTVSELERLSNLHDQGALSDEEFAAAKQQLLGS